MKFKKLKDFNEEQKSDILTIRATDAWLIREPAKTLYVKLDEESEIMTTSKELIMHYEGALSSLDWLKKKLSLWSNPSTKKLRIATPEHPLEMVAGDICLVLVIEGKEYILNTYRDIPFEGWVLPGGHSGNLDEIFNPKLIAAREAFEEVLIGDINGRFYSLGSLANLEKNLQDWNLKPKEIIFPPIEEISLKRGDVQNLLVEMNNRQKRIENINLTIDSQASIVMLTLYWRLKLSIKLAELRLFDGERDKNGLLLNRVVRLTTKERTTAAMFYSGQNILLAGWSTPGEEKRAIIS